ncbi:MAG: DNA-directed RNA polymerase subunit H [Methanomassiliicoccales archaeon]|nr:DNA-directed RNA polymerase subunit H [Methanomassiliicoccales archaeon]
MIILSEGVQFNVFNHELVPAHHLLSEEDAKSVLEALKIDKDQLPKIRRSDPCIRLLEEKYGHIKEGRVVKVIRRSVTAERADAYRLVVRG